MEKLNFNLRQGTTPVKYATVFFTVIPQIALPKPLHYTQKLKAQWRFWCAVINKYIHIAECSNLSAALELD
jgi:hypothetical protein